MILNRMIICILLILLPHTLGIPRLNTMTIWNVGQGQWITHSSNSECVHFDVGGEFFNPQTLKDLCYGKRSIILYSHADWDHVSFSGKLSQNFTSCVFKWPIERTKNRFKKISRNLNSCKEHPEIDFRDISPHFPKHGKGSMSSNDLSSIFWVGEFLIPGDSTQKMEHHWVNNLRDLSVKYLILGHHGSKTSSSEKLLQSLPHLKLTIASARHQRYGHPHLPVLKRLKRRNIPLLRTEDWGNIHFILRK